MNPYPDTSSRQKRVFPQTLESRGFQVCHVHNYCGVVDCVVGCAWDWVELTTSLSSLLGLKNGIFLAGTSTRSPVLGLRPTRGLRCRVRKLPKPRISILSPTRSERTMLSKMVSTMTSLSLRVNSASRETSSIRSAFVIHSSLHIDL